MNIHTAKETNCFLRTPFTQFGKYKNFVRTRKSKKEYVRVNLCRLLPKYVDVQNPQELFDELKRYSHKVSIGSTFTAFEVNLM